MLWLDIIWLYLDSSKFYFLLIIIFYISNKLIKSKFEQICDLNDPAYKTIVDNSKSIFNCFIGLIIQYIGMFYIQFLTILIII
jgi:hypothetical protein